MRSTLETLRFCFPSKLYFSTLERREKQTAKMASFGIFGMELVHA